MFSVFVMRGCCQMWTLGRVISFRCARILVCVIRYFEQSNFISQTQEDTSTACGLGRSRSLSFLSQSGVARVMAGFKLVRAPAVRFVSQARQVETAKPKNTAPIPSCDHERRREGTRHCLIVIRRYQYFWVYSMTRRYLR